MTSGDLAAQFASDVNAQLNLGPLTPPNGYWEPTDHPFFRVNDLLETFGGKFWITVTLFQSVASRYDYWGVGSDFPF